MMRRALRRAAAIAALTIAATSGVLAPATVAHAASSRAVVIIGNSTYTISFTGTITGLQALRLAASSVETLGFGGIGEAVCKINGVGNAPTPSTCLLGPNGEYWAYYRAEPGATGWQYSSRGAGSTSVTDGSVEGWRYGTGGPPTFVSFCTVAGCAPPSAPTTAATAAPATGSGTSSGGSAGTGTAPGNGTGAGPSTAPDPGGATTSTSAARDDASRGEQANGATGGRPDITADDPDDSPVGAVIAGGLVVALGGVGVWLRRHRKVVT